MFLSRFSLFFITSVIAFSFLLTPCFVDAKSAKQMFSVQDVNVPFSVSQPILPVNLLSDSGIELVAIGVDEQNIRWLAIYGLNSDSGKTELVEKHKIPKQFFGYDISPVDDENPNKIQQLYFISRDEIVYFQTSNKLNEKLAKQQGGQTSPFVKYQAIDSMYLVEEVAFLARQSFVKDINNDGKDDFVLQHFEKYNVWLSTCCNKYHFQSLPLKAKVNLNNNVVTFKQHKLYFVDVDLDQLEDIVWVSKGRIEYFSQLANGKYSSQVQTIVLADNIYGENWWNIREADGDNLDQSKLSHRVVEEITDINGDGLVDVVVRFTQSSGVLERTNDYEFYFGSKQQGQLTNTLSFSTFANSTIKAEGTLTGLTIIDINNDNRFEVMLSSFELSLTNIIGALISGSIEQDVLLFSLANQQKFKPEPITSKEVELSFSLSKGRSGNPVVILLDVNGDGLQDLLLSDDDDSLKLYLGKNNKNLFSKKAIKQTINLPSDGDNVQSLDINNDGKDDVIMHYGRLDDKKMSHKFTILLGGIE